MFCIASSKLIPLLFLFAKKVSQLSSFSFGNVSLFADRQKFFLEGKNQHSIAFLQILWCQFSIVPSVWNLSCSRRYLELRFKEILTLTRFPRICIFQSKTLNSFYGRALNLALNPWRNPFNLLHGMTYDFPRFISCSFSQSKSRFSSLSCLSHITWWKLVLYTFKLFHNLLVLLNFLKQKVLIFKLQYFLINFRHVMKWL